MGLAGSNTVDSVYAKHTLRHLTKSQQSKFEEAIMEVLTDGDQFFSIER